MVLVAEQVQPTSAATEGFIGRIPVRSLWLLMLYASDLFRIAGIGNVKLDERPDNLLDLIGEILAHAVERRQRRRLNFGYRTRYAALSRVRGRIDPLRTESHQLTARGMIGCRFDDLTIDTPRNRFVRAALETVAPRVNTALAHRCRMLARSMAALGVSGRPPSHTEMSAERFGRHDADDRYMVAAAKLAFDLVLPSEAAGANLLPLPNREEIWVRKLFERAVAGFYAVVLSPQGWQVRPGVPLHWPTDRTTAGIGRLLPSMRTDVILDDPASRRRIVVDTKFTAIVTSGWHRDSTLKSGQIYQIYAYLRPQVGSRDRMSNTASGLLLYPALGEMIDETAVIQGHAIRFATVDLTASAAGIRSQLLQVCEPSLQRGNPWIGCFLLPERKDEPDLGIC
jgi:5-methylcytosine-specific restriction enzyme subunit McrC